jgi:hypothetical protein
MPSEITAAYLDSDQQAGRDAGYIKDEHIDKLQYIYE